MKEYFRLLKTIILEDRRFFEPEKYRGSLFVNSKTLEVIHHPGDLHGDLIERFPNIFGTNPKKRIADQLVDAMSRGWVRVGLAKQHDGHHSFYLEGNHEGDLRSVVAHISTGLQDKSKFSIQIDPPHLSEDIHGTDILEDHRDIERYINNGHVDKRPANTTGLDSLRDRFTRSTTETNPPVNTSSYVYTTIGDSYDPSLKEQWSEYDIKVGETNTSLFDESNIAFNMKAFLKKLRKKNGVKGKLAEE